MIALHMGGIPELALALGPLLLIAVFVKIARSAEARDGDDPADEWDDWDDAGGTAVVQDTTRAEYEPTRVASSRSAPAASRSPRAD